MACRHLTLGWVVMCKMGAGMVQLQPHLDPSCSLTRTVPTLPCLYRSTTEKLLHDERVQCYLLRPKTLTARAVCLSVWLILVCGFGAFCWFVVPLVLKDVVNPLQEAIRVTPYCLSLVMLSLHLSHQSHKEGALLCLLLCPYPAAGQV